MSICDGGSLAISDLLMLLIMSMIAIDKIAKFAQSIPKVSCFDFGVVEMSVYEKLRCECVWILLIVLTF